MSVASRNAFALLDDDPSAPAPVAAPAKEKAAAGAAAGAPKRSIPGLNSNADGQRNGARSGADRSRGAAAAAGEADADASQRRENRGGRGGARGAGRGGRGGRGAGARGGRRPFDRHSQTGKTDSDKKIEQGWGGEDPERELDAENAAKADAAEEEGAEKPAKEDAPTANGSAEKKETIVEEEEPDNTKTLDEYLAEQAAKRAQLGSVQEVRKADVDAESLGQRVTKQAGDDYYAINKERTVRQRERKEKQVLEIEQSFNPPPSATRGSGRGGRGGRGAARGARGGERGGRGAFGGERGRGAARGGSRGGRGGSNAAGANINLSDSDAFPTLG